MSRRSSVIFLLSAFVSSTASAATLSGVAATRDGRPLPHVPLRVVGTSATHTVITGAGGAFAVDVPSGSYRIESGLSGLVVVAPATAATVADGGPAVAVVLGPAPVRENVVVTAARGEAASSSLGVTVSALDHERIEAREAITLTQLLQDLPGVSVNRSGPPGRQTTVFVRGGGSTHTRVLVDGVAVNEPGGFFDHGSALGHELQQVEVVRGAASSLYGSDALAGVISIETRRPGPGEPRRAHLTAEGGGFGHRRVAAGTSGRSGRIDWNVAGLRLLTDNDVPNSSFRETAGAVALGLEVSPRWTLQWTARGSDSFHGTPGQTGFGLLDHDAYFGRTDVVSSVRLRGTAGRLRHELRAGIAVSNQLSLDPSDSGARVPTYQGRTGAWGPSQDFPDPDGYQNETLRTVFGYQAEMEAARHLVSAGVDVEQQSGDLGTRGQPLLSPERTNAGLYVQDRWAIAPTLFVTAGARLEHNDSFGTALVPRAALSWILRENGGRSTRLKASAGAGIKEPGFFESFGTSDFARGNPDLKAERSRTYDAGIEQRAFTGRLRLELTAFHHDYRDQIAYRLLDPVTYFGTYENLGRARARGLEVEAEAQPRRGFSVRGQYTYTDSEVLVSTAGFDPLLAVGQPLLRRPRHMGSVTVEGGPAGGRVRAAFTAVFVGARADSDFAGLDLLENAGHTRVDARLRAQVVRRAELYVVAENLLDAEYHEVLGFPGLGRAVRAGVRLRTDR